MNERDCTDCKFAGWDPDGMYCAEPSVMVAWPYGLALHSKNLATYCPAPTKPLWVQRPADRYPSGDPRRGE